MTQRAELPATWNYPGEKPPVAIIVRGQGSTVVVRPSPGGSAVDYDKTVFGTPQVATAESGYGSTITVAPHNEPPISRGSMGILLDMRESRPLPLLSIQAPNAPDGWASDVLIAGDPENPIRAATLAVAFGAGRLSCSYVKVSYLFLTSEPGAAITIGHGVTAERVVHNGRMLFESSHEVSAIDLRELFPKPKSPVES